ncbi:cation diffusion facilitator family transporter [Ferdinandcohnia quinoae]|uniref:Cation diffusion facilitator family transporter n=1 Tax=Fredinandcohnia quinoae TaxID=2918902 RepID=A0AAW5E5N2_9BACI|nr:cation diffusion facilitator family transporter [Fredinandcohnia sp. SECRCQ15]MCH1627658.1 cation diffusion facilitator family transporter [Fredinandcohnia sp. SECRCQ15]
MENQDRFKQAEKAILYGVIGNILLAVIKWIIGIMSNSRALIADAVHSASDVAGSVAVYLGVRAAKQPPDEDHPYGHGKAESVSAIIVAVLLFIVGIEMGKASIGAFFEPIKVPKSMAIYAVVFSIIIKEIMFRYKYKLGKKIRSDALIINAYDDRSDVYASLATLVGIVAAIIGGKLGLEWMVYADPVAGLVVSVLILKMAWEFGSDAIHTTLDHVLHEEETNELKKVVLTVPEVKKITELHAREHGHYVIVDLKISVDPYMTVEEGHRVGKEVKAKLMEIHHVQNVLVHINPYSEDDSKYE